MSQHYGYWVSCPFTGPDLAHRPLFLMSLPMDNSPYWGSPPLQLTLNEQQPITPLHHHPSIYPPNTPLPSAPARNHCCPLFTLIHSRRYWFSVGKIKKAMNFNAFCLSLSPLSLSPSLSLSLSLSLCYTPHHLFPPLLLLTHPSAAFFPGGRIKERGMGHSWRERWRGWWCWRWVISHFRTLDAHPPPPFLLTSLLIAGTIRMETRNDPSGRSSLIPCVWLYTSLCYLN